MSNERTEMVVRLIQLELTPEQWRKDRDRIIRAAEKTGAILRSIETVEQDDEFSAEFVLTFAANNDTYGAFSKVMGMRLNTSIDSPRVRTPNQIEGEFTAFLAGLSDEEHGPYFRAFQTDMERRKAVAAALGEECGATL